MVYIPTPEATQKNHVKAITCITRRNEGIASLFASFYVQVDVKWLCLYVQVNVEWYGTWQAGSLTMKLYLSI